MKKLLLVLVVVALSSFLFVGCIPSAPDGGEGEGEGEVCPTLDIGAVPVAGINYVKGDLEDSYALDYAIIFDVPTEGVNVYIRGEYSAGTPEAGTLGVSLIPFPNADKTVYSGSVPIDVLAQFFLAWEELSCNAYVISIEACDGECICEYPFVVDWIPPIAGIEFALTLDEPGYGTLTIDSAFCDIDDPCDPETVYCCEEECSGLASWNIDLYTDVPFDECCELITEADGPCTPGMGIFWDECHGTDCAAIACEFNCIPLSDDLTLYVVFTLEDNVGHITQYYGTIDLSLPDSVVVSEFQNCDFSDTPSVVDILGWDCTYLCGE